MYRRTVYIVVKLVSFCHIKVNHAQKCPHMFTILSPIPAYVHRRMAVCKKGKFSRATAQKRPWWSHSELESTFQRWGPSKEITKYILDLLELLITKNRLSPRPFSANVMAMAPKILVKTQLVNNYWLVIHFNGYDNFRTKVAVLARSQNVFSKTWRGLVFVNSRRALEWSTYWAVLRSEIFRRRDHPFTTQG